MKYQAPNGEIIEIDNPNLLNILEREGFKLVEDKPNKSKPTK